jgi:hypothetical protein
MNGFSAKVFYFIDVKVSLIIFILQSMNLRSALAAFFLIISIPANSQSLYNPSGIQVVELSFPQANWDYLLDSLVSASEEERLMGSLTLNGQFFDSVGVRYKGNSSYSASNIKNPLNIKLDYGINNQETNDGYGTLKLSNLHKDPSFLREVLAYEIAGKYFPASLANYAKVFINGTYIGLYTNIQDVDKLFCRANFGEDEGVRMKGEIDGLLPGSSWTVWQYLGADSTQYFNKYKLESDFGWNRFIGFLDTLNNQNAFIHQKLNIDRHLWFLAFSNLLVNLDGPINNPQNYYLYQDAAGRFNPIPWDFNECFGGFVQLYASPPLTQNGLIQLNPLLNLSNTNYPIISKILSDGFYKKVYLAHYKTIMDENFSNGWYADRALELQNLISTEVQNDPNQFFSYSYFLDNLNSTVGIGPQSFIGITQLMDARVSWLNAQSVFQTLDPQIHTVEHYPEYPVTGGEVIFSAQVSEASQVYLKYRNPGQLIFQTKLMYDDGNHSDNASGDGLWAVSSGNLSSGVEYYILAENADAVAFDPPRAENEFHIIYIRNDLVINEFSASNTEVPDQNGEFEDWVELYNTSEQSIALGGYFLSDDLSNPQKWMFPDTVIQSDAYLVIWADEDETQTGLHANFKLSKSGESLILSDAMGNTIDFLSFLEQKTDTSTGRYPNGVGELTFLPPTPGAVNGSLLEIQSIPGFVENIKLQLGQNYPNPAGGSTRIPYQLNQAASVELQIYSLPGQLIYFEEAGYQSVGAYEIILNTNYLSPGWYFYRLKADEVTAVGKMMIMRD